MCNTEKKKLFLGLDKLAIFRGAPVKKKVTLYNSVLGKLGEPICFIKGLGLGQIRGRPDYIQGVFF